MKNLLILMLVAASAQAQLKPVSYSHGTQKLNGFAISPAKQKAAGVLVLPAWRGIDAHSKASAEKLAQMGYHAFVADIYGEGNIPGDSKEAGEKSGQFKADHELYQARIRAALDQLIAQGADPGRIAVIGYCFGGTGALEAARANMPVRGVVAFHGGLGRDAKRPIVTIQPKVLVCHGADDFFVPEAEIDAFQKEMKTADADWQMIYYADAVHAFTEPSAGNDKSKGTAYNEKAAKRSWEHMKLFFEEILK